jgi:hypothetical protein
MRGRLEVIDVRSAELDPDGVEALREAFDGRVLDPDAGCSPHAGVSGLDPWGTL